MAVYHHCAIVNKQEGRITMLGKVVRNCISTALRYVKEEESVLEEDRHVYDGYRGVAEGRAELRR